MPVLLIARRAGQKYVRDCIRLYTEVKCPSGRHVLRSEDQDSREWPSVVSASWRPDGISIVVAAPNNPGLRVSRLWIRSRVSSIPGRYPTYRSALTCSGFSGRRLGCWPVASNTAFATAAAVATVPASPADPHGRSRREISSSFTSGSSAKVRIG